MVGNSVCVFQFYRTLNQVIMNILRYCKSSAFIVCAFAFMVSSCKKESSDKQTTSSQPLFNGSWKLTKFEIKGSDGEWVQTTPPSLVGSEVLTFSSNGTYNDASSGATGTWNFFNNGQSITISTVSYQIAILNSSTLQLVKTDETFPYSVNGTTATYYGERDTYSH